VLGLQDRRIGEDNQLVYKSTMMDEMNGVLGDRVLVNGRADAAFDVAPRPYRLRIANLSNARIYKLGWSDDRPLSVIASDAGLFSRAEGVQERPYVTLFPFERVELVEDFGVRRDGAEIALVSRAFSAAGHMMGPMMGAMGGPGGSGRRGRGGMRGGMMGGPMGGAAQGAELEIARFTVSPGRRPRAERLVLPEAEPSIALGRSEIRTQLSFRMMRGFLNGRSYDSENMTTVAEDERLPVSESSVWTFANDGPGMPMSHAMHVHGVRFRVVERTGAVPPDLREGVIDTGYKDVVGVFAGEQVRVQVVPTVAGLFLYHCHNLEHEDGGMMRNVVFGSVDDARAEPA
jgi:bilirubin oxidase